MQPTGIQNIPSPANPLFPPELAQRARTVVEALSREIEQSQAEQYQRREVPEVQHVQMNQAVVSAHPFAMEFGRTASLDYMLFDNQEQTKQSLIQAALLREQYRILQGEEQYYTMSLEDVTMTENSLRMAISTLKAAYAQKVKQHMEQIRAAGHHTDGQLSKWHVQ